jgi:hypothetical protein
MVKDISEEDKMTELERLEVVFPFAKFTAVHNFPDGDYYIDGLPKRSNWAEIGLEIATLELGVISAPSVRVQDYKRLFAVYFDFKTSLYYYNGGCTYRKVLSFRQVENMYWHFRKEALSSKNLVPFLNIVPSLFK